MFKHYVLLGLVMVTNVETARILGIFPTPSVSHQIVYQPVLEELSKRGHEIVSITPNPMRNPSLQNYTEIYIHKAYEFWIKTFNFTSRRHLGPKYNNNTIFEGITVLCEEIFNLAEVTHLITNHNEHFDLVIVEWFFCPSMAMFSHRFQAPLIGITSCQTFSTLHEMVGNPTHPVHYPNIHSPKAHNLNFWQRLYSTYSNFLFRWYYYCQFVPKEDAIARKYFGNDIPYLTTILSNLSLLFTNTHPILGGPRPLVPTTLEIGGTGLHIKETKPLPKDLLKYLDEATDGAIYFSLGSNVKSSEISVEKRREILAAFAEMPYRVLWKWESDYIPSLPNNVKLSKWFPQQDVLVLGLVITTTVENARILGIFPTPSVSQQIVYQPVLKELSKRGHEIVSVTPNPMRDPSMQNYTEIYIHMAYEFWVKTFNFTLGRHLGHGPKDYTYGLFEGTTVLCEKVLNMVDVMQLINKPNEHFDLVIVEWIFCPAMAMFSHRFQAPLVGIASFHAFITLHDMVGNPTHPVHYPDFFLPKANNLNFRQRLYSTYYIFWFRWYYYRQLIPKEDAIARKYFGNDIPYLTTILNNLSFLFTNTHPILGGPRPLVPTTLEIGGTGLHIKETKPLPMDLLKYLDEATDGAIYFSLGSNVKSNAISEEKRREILAAFAEMPYNILWKWESDSMPGLPNNVKLSKWFPQQDVLGHPNIKLFITQGGLQSLEEAIRNRVPLVGIPFFADQDYNVDKIVYLGIGVSMELNTLTKEDLTHAVYTVINNTSYKEKITKMADMIYDQPIKPLDHTVWWIEYVLRHKGTRALRSPAIDSPFYIHFHIDVLVFVFVITIVFLLIIYKLYMYILRLVDNRIVNKLKVK